MQIGDHLFRARKSSGLSQEAVAEKLGVSRQTISKWETNETLPDIEQSRRLAQLYHVSLGELTAFDVDIKEIERVIHPSELFWSKESWYCVAFCELRQDTRVFELNRIRKYMLLDEGF